MSAFEESVKIVEILKTIVDWYSMHDYASHCLTLWSKLKSAGFENNEKFAGSMMLCAFIAELKPLMISIESIRKQITVNFVKKLKKK